MLLVDPFLKNSIDIIVKFLILNLIAKMTSASLKARLNIHAFLMVMVLSEIAFTRTNSDSMAPSTLPITSDGFTASFSRCLTSFV